MDWFDKVRNCMFQLYQKYGKVIPTTCGVNWMHDWDETPSGIIPDSAQFMLGGHDCKLAGWTTKKRDGSFINPFTQEPFIVIQNSWGERYGDRGLFYASRAIFNKYFNVYGAGYIVDDPDLQIQKLGFMSALLQNIVSLYQAIQGLIYKKKVIENTTPKPPLNPEPIPPPIPPPPPPETLKDMAARVCGEEQLSAQMKERLLRTIQEESGFDNEAVHHNIDIKGLTVSTDWYLCQVNDFYHIGLGKDFPSAQYVHDHPEEVVRWMARLFKAGKATLWVAYQRLYGNT